MERVAQKSNHIILGFARRVVPRSSTALRLSQWLAKYRLRAREAVRGCVGPSAGRSCWQRWCAAVGKGPPDTVLARNLGHRAARKDRWMTGRWRRADSYNVLCVARTNSRDRNWDVHHAPDRGCLPLKWQFRKLEDKILRAILRQHIPPILGYNRLLYVVSIWSTFPGVVQTKHSHRSLKLCNTIKICLWLMRNILGMVNS